MAETGVDIVADVSFVVPAGTVLGIVGESGSGKTTVAHALVGAAKAGTRIASGNVEVGGVDLLALNEDSLRAIRGRLISFVPQNQSRSLSPGMRVADQLREMIAVHAPGADADSMLKRAWEGAQLPFEPEFLARYPHQLSGGQQQRVAIAMALVCEPRFMIMDEPTTGLDVLTQARLLDVVRGIRETRELGIVYISHDLGVVRSLVDEVAVMYGGRIVERASVEHLFTAPAHPYTRRLLEATPRLHRETDELRGIPGHAVEPSERPSGCAFAPRCEFRIEQCETDPPPLATRSSGRDVRCWRADELVGRESFASRERRRVPALKGHTPLLTVRDLVAGYGRLKGRGGRAETLAVRGVSFDLSEGECVALVGESGSGKSTIARCIVGLHAPLSGEIAVGGTRLPGLAADRDTSLRQRIQIVFQDPDSSLNPSMSIGRILGRPLRQFSKLGRQAERQRIAELLEQVHLPPSMASRLPRELSGGQKQRVAIARALAADPRLLVCDEVTSALDVAVQASILELLEELRASIGMAVLFISHDLAVVRAISDVVVVLERGEIREVATRATLFSHPTADYTRRLLEAVPDLQDEDYPSMQSVHRATSATVPSISPLTGRGGRR
ncbi:MAG: ABC transporter ATP-binding protein [Gaiellales bacterium]